MARAYYGDIAIYTVGGSDQLGFIDKVQLIKTTDTQDGGSIPYFGESPQIVKNSAKISSSHMSNVTGAGRVTNLEVSAFTLGGTSYVADLQGGSFDCGFSHSMDDGVNDVWEAPSVTNRSYKGNVKLLVPAAAVQTIVGAQFPANYAAIPNLKFTFSITINGVAVTLPVVGKSCEIGADYGKNQEVTIGWEGQHPQSASAYPTAPIGTTSLLEKALNAARTALAFDFKTHATNGHRFQGDMVWESYGFQFNNREIVKSSMSWSTTGTVTYTQIGT